MKFGILGPLRVSSGDSVLDLGAPAQRTLLAILLTSPGTPVSDDRFIDELWGEDPPSSAHHLLQVYVSRLRALVGAPSNGLHIVREGAGYALRVGAGELDSELFGDALGAARPLVGHDPEAVDRILTPAMGLWRGTPFADLLDPPQAIREHALYLERLHREALGTWIDVRLQLGRHRELVPELAALVGQQPYDEALHAQHMLALYRCGRQAEALETSRALEARLRDDLGIDPSPEIRDLYRDILLQAPYLNLEPPEPPGNLPSRLTSFVGRTRELQELAGLILESRLVTLTGPGGIGKTRLALEVARQHRSQFPDGTWWIDLAPVTDPETVLDQVAGALGMAPMPGPALLGAIARALGRRRVLLLIDNCEHVAAAVADVVSALLRATTVPRVLATSRVRLGVEGERLWPSPPLSRPNAGPIARLADSEAVQLFVERGRAVSPRFTLDAGNAAAVGEVCRRLDGLSLAIEMAAARLAVLSPKEIARHLDDRFALLELSAVGRPTRHRTMEAAIDASHALLSQGDQAVFDRLSVFVGSFDLEAAGAVGFASQASPGEVLAAATVLVDASMLTPERNGDETRYRLLETLREYGLARLRSLGVEDEVRQAHAEHYLEIAARAAVDLCTPDVAPWMTRLSLDYTELRQALGWSLAHQARAVTLRAAPALRELWFRGGTHARLDDGPPRCWKGTWRPPAPMTVPSFTLRRPMPPCWPTTSQPPVPSPKRRFGWRVGVRPRRPCSAPCGEGRRSPWPAATLRRFGATRSRCSRSATGTTTAGDAPGRSPTSGSRRSSAAAAGGSPRLVRGGAAPLSRVGQSRQPRCHGPYPAQHDGPPPGDLPAAERYAMEAVEISSGTGWEASALVIYGEALAARGDLGRL